MTYWEGLLLGIVQGLTEFLPISSSGHLVVAQAAVGLSAPGVVVEVILHVATLLAVVIVYRARLWTIARGCIDGDRSAWRFVGLLTLATIPAAVAGLVWSDVFERAFDSLRVVGIDFLVTGAVLWSTRPVIKRADRPEPSVMAAGGIGIAQALAIFPGISRSGTTVAAALWWRVEPERAAEFSFVLAIPAILGAAVLQLPALGSGAVQVDTGPLLGSFVAALISGVLAIRLLVALLRRKAFHRFAPYCWAIGSATIAWTLMS